MTDAAGNVSQFNYDNADRMIQKIDPLNQTTTYSYDASSNLTAIVDRNGRRRAFTHDALNRMSAESWFSPTNVLVNQINHSYDGTGNLIGIQDDFSQYSFSYDVLNRMTQTSNAGTTGLPTVVLTNTFDKVGNRTAVSDQTGVAINSIYDVRIQLTSRRWSGSSISDARVDFSYNARNERTQTTRFSDLTGANRVGRTTFAYTPTGVTSKITHLSAVDAAIVDFDYARDIVDQITSWSHHGKTINYSHDLSGQLLSADYSTTQNDEDFSYDGTGNRTNSGYVTGANNQVLADSTFDYVYDNERNLVRQTVRSTGIVTESSFDHRTFIPRQSSP